MHWASNLIGLPWTHEHNCWALVQRVFVERYGIDMPSVDIASDDNVRSIKQAAEVSGWRRADGPAQDGDIVLMNSLRGRHCGVMIECDGRLLLLHNNGRMTPRGPVGCVVAQTLADATRDGYHDYECWRKSP